MLVFIPIKQGATPDSTRLNQILVFGYSGVASAWSEGKPAPTLALSGCV